MEQDSDLLAGTQVHFNLIWCRPILLPIIPITFVVTRRTDSDVVMKEEQRNGQKRYNSHSHMKDLQNILPFYLTNDPTRGSRKPHNRFAIIIVCCCRLSWRLILTQEKCGYNRKAKPSVNHIDGRRTTCGVVKKPLQPCITTWIDDLNRFCHTLFSDATIRHTDRGIRTIDFRWSWSRLLESFFMEA